MAEPVPLVSFPPLKRALVVFDPTDRTNCALYSDCSAADILPALRALVDRLERGTLRMPLDGGVKFVDVPEATK